MVTLLAYQRGKTLETFLRGLPVREFEDDNEFYWDVIGSSRRNIPLVEARDENGSTITQSRADSDDMVGANTAPFELVFGEDWSKAGRLI